MGVFDLFLGGLKKHARRVANRDAQAEDREASARWLADSGTEEALVALCGRFNLQLEHSLKDQKEKDLVLDLLAEKGADGTAAVRVFARSSLNFIYALRLVERVEGSEAGTALLLDLVASERVEDEFKPEKKRRLLISLAERRDPRIVEAASRFLVDFDEGVRHAAVEALASQEGDAARLPLFRALTNPREESTRIRGRIGEVFVQRRWGLPEPSEWLSRNPPPGCRVEGERLVAGR